MDPISAPTARIVVDEHDLGTRLDRIVSDRLTPLSRSRAKALIESGRVSVDAATIANPSFRVKPGQVILIDVPAAIDDTPQPQPIELVVIYEDAHLIVIDKPAGMVVHPAPGNQDSTLVNALLAHCGDSLMGIGGVRRPGIVHRLDKDTSGLMVAAKTEPVHTALSAAFADRTIERAYRALVWGLPMPATGTIDRPIGRSPFDRKKMAVVPRGKPAITNYKLLKPLGPDAALVECRLRTGRTHQIRVHLSALGHPLIGDQTYGRRPALAKLQDKARGEHLLRFPRQALHAWLLGFEHPATGNRLRFDSQFPADLAELLCALE